jgi:ATPase subunit of ABC transporter with duplicated ATPase domains
MISVSNVTMRYGSKLLFEDVSVTFTTGRRYGLTGPNGAGKSTFMKCLTGEIDPQKGTVVRPRKIGVLSQDQYAFDAYRVIDTVIMGNKALWAALEEREIIYNKAEMTDEDGSRLGELEGTVGDEDGYEAEANAAVLLQGLDIPDELHDRKMSELQGGQKVRVLLAQALFGNPQALLLDEPTNYLDLESIHWLQDFLIRYNGTVITISHDRHFLNNVCTHIADIDYETIITYNGGYDDMVFQKTSVRTRIESQNEQREKKIAQLNDFIARFSAGTRSSQVNSRKKEVERLATSELARSNIARPYIAFKMERPSGKNVLEFEHVNKSYEQKDGKVEHVINDFSASISRGDKVILMGRNGQGKTTLLKALLANGPGIDEKDVSIDSGSVKWGHEAQIGYFAQDHKGSIQLGMTASDWLHQFDPQATKEDIRGILGQMLFKGEEGLKKTDALSGGCAAAVLQDHAAEAERAGTGRANESP